MQPEPLGGWSALLGKALMCLDLGASVSDNILAIFRKPLSKGVFATPLIGLSLFYSTKEDNA
jgi:hypothetical protein